MISQSLLLNKKLEISQKNNQKYNFLWSWFFRLHLFEDTFLFAQDVSDIQLTVFSYVWRAMPSPQQGKFSALLEDRLLPFVAPSSSFKNKGISIEWCKNLYSHENSTHFQKAMMRDTSHINAEQDGVNHYALYFSCKWSTYWLTFMWFT